METEIIDSKAKLLESLKEGSTADFFIRLNGGLRSSKTVRLYEDNTVTLYNDIDDTVEDFDSVDELCQQTNIGEAIEKKALYRWL